MPKAFGQEFFMGTHEVEFVQIFEVFREKGSVIENDSWHFEQDVAEIKAGETTAKVRTAIGVKIGHDIFTISGKVSIDISDPNEIRDRVRKQALSLLSRSQRIALGLPPD